MRKATGAEIIVALKANAMWSIFPELSRHSDGATASSLAEARLVFEEYGAPAHTYAPVYTEGEIGEILNCSNHITFIRWDNTSVSDGGPIGQVSLVGCG